MTTQTTAVEQLIDIYCSAWNEPEQARREEILAAVWAEDATYTDPLIDARGRHELAAMIGSALAHHPNSRYARSTEVDSHHNVARFGWQHLSPEGTVRRRGVDFVELDDAGKIRRIAAFFEPV